jgi:ankyrin repeat protein
MILSLIYNNDFPGLLKVIDSQNLNVVDSYGDGPLHFAVLSGNQEIVQLILDRRLDVNSKNFDGKTALHLAAEKESISLLRLLMEYSADIHSEDNFGNQPLWVSVFNASAGEIEKLVIVTFLLENGADVNHKNKHGVSPLEFARKIDFQPLILLLERFTN